MNIFITGGAGFIGSNLASELVSRNHQVKVFDSLDSGYLENIDSLSGVDFIKGDVRDADLVYRSMLGADYVFHLAASVGNKKSIEHPTVDAEVNVIGTINILEAARQTSIKKVVFSSSAGTFGELRTIPIRADHPTYPDSPYGCSKLCAEKLCGAYTNLYGLPTVALRYFNVYGPNQRFDAYGNVIPIFVHKLMEGETLTVFGDGEQTRDFVNVADVVQANIESAFAEGVTGAFNIGSGKRVTINQLVKMLGRVSGIDPFTRLGPERKGDVKHSLADIDEGVNAFGYCPKVELEQGLQQYWNWAQSDKVDTSSPIPAQNY